MQQETARIFGEIVGKRFRRQAVDKCETNCHETLKFQVFRDKFPLIHYNREVYP